MSGILWRVVPWCFVVAALFAGYLTDPWIHEDTRRVVAEIAGDEGLPGSTPLQTRREVRSSIEHLAQNRDAYRDFLKADSVFVLVMLLGCLAVAWLRWSWPPKLWPVTLIVTALAYAASGWTQNGSLASLLASTPSELEAYRVAASASNARWFFGALSLVLALVQVLAYFGPWRPWFLALFHDVPSFLDRASRRIEFRLNCELDLGGDDKSQLRLRAFWRMPAFWFFAATAVFVCYGPTLDGLCSTSTVMVRVVLGVVCLGLIAGIVLALRRIVPWIRDRVGKYAFPGSEDGDLAKRRGVTYLFLGACTALLLAPALFAASSALFTAMGSACSGAAFSPLSVYRFFLCLAAIAAFAAVWSMQLSTRRLIAWQAVILAATALLYWFVLASPQATEGSGHPYRHLFAFVAPVVVFVLWLAPKLARRLIGAPLEPLKSQFSGALAREQLFKGREAPPMPTGGLVVHAMLYGIAYRALQFALIPSLIALVAPPEWLLSMAAAGLVVSIGLTTWANLWLRWKQMVVFVERWFLSGAAYFVTLFVVAVAVCRIAGVSYVTTLLDGAPFGTIFSGTVMCYVLSWLVEYWVNRAAGAELLGVLGDPGDVCAIRFAYEEPDKRRKADDFGVEHADRRLMYHALGRFLVVGRQPGRESPAFHTYSLTELFSELSKGGAGTAGAVRVDRQVHLYFYAVNFALALVAATFIGTYWYIYNIGDPAPVVTARVQPPVEPLRDLADALLAPRDDNRPAIVVVASGGGTRAAAFTAHALEGLHRLGIDRDIVLTSGVSGGGVALAYFALHYRELSAPDGAQQHWQRFKALIEGDYIGDVLEGATEWRIFGPAPLSVLLAESFERRLFADAPRPATFALPQTPALILNTTISGHPEADSALLRTTLNRPKPKAPCSEQQRPYKLLHGGRLIFTNLKDTSAFPDISAPIADVRLPYTIVRDAEVRLAAAAALNANFPPVFPNARVDLTGADDGAECPERSYFVTDGGAQENLGLVSALYAVQSALDRIEVRCGADHSDHDSWCRRRLRPIHFVIAEASATGYDYTQDRGMSAGLEGAKDRLTGGLTNELVDITQRLYKFSPLNRNPLQELRFHVLAMPLVFRARGGIGTHWTHAYSFRLSDPRVRHGFASWIPAELRFVGIRETVDLDWRRITRLWQALHDPDKLFCDNTDWGDIDTDEIRRWICGWRHDAYKPRDLHVLEWKKLVNTLRAPPISP